MENQTFGAFLKEILRTRNLSVSKIAELTGNKSKTSVIRLLNDESRDKTIQKFAKSLAESVELTSEEQRQMERILNKEAVPLSLKNASDSLLRLFDRRGSEYSDKFICVAYNAEATDNVISFYDLFRICLEGESVIVIEDVISCDMVFALNKIIHETAKQQISPVIEHYFKADEGIEAKGKQLTALIKLSTYSEYNAYDIRHRFPIEKKIIIMTQKNKKINMRLIEFSDSNKLFYSDVIISKAFCEHLNCRRKVLKEHSVPLISEPLQRDELLEMLLMLERFDSIPSLQINQTPAYMMIPFDIQCRLFEACNYIGLGKEHPYIQKLYKVLESRADFIKNSGVKRKMILTKDGIERFFSTGKTSDYFRPFERLTADECKRTLEYIRDIESIECKILKDEYTVYDSEFIIYTGNKICIYDPIWGWWENWQMAEITGKRALETITNFYNDILWEKCCFGLEDSARIIDEIAAECVLQMKNI